MGAAAFKLDEELRTDARDATRADVYASVDLHSEHNFWSGFSMNMSEGGLFVATHRVVPVGTRLTLSMVLPFASQPIVTTVEVRWTRGYSDQADVPPGLGLQFVDTDAVSLAHIRRFVSTMREPLFFDE
jgi:uncharacterized protein (TIGR02266 family)